MNLDVFKEARQAALDSGMPVMEMLDDGTVVERLKDGSVWFVKKLGAPIVCESTRFSLPS